MSIRFIYRRETPRAWARAIAPTQVLRERNVAVAAQLQSTLDLRTTYDITVLTDWTPTGEPIERFDKTIYWDLPEDILQHLDEQPYNDLLKHVQGIITHSPHVAEYVRGLVPRVVVLPTLLPDIHLRAMTSSQQDKVIGIFGPCVIAPYQHHLQRILDEQKLGLFTTEQYMAEHIRPAMHCIPEFVPYVQLLSRCPIVFSPQMANNGADPFWLRNALFLGIPTIVSGGWEGLPDHPGILNTKPQDLATTITKITDTTWAPIMRDARQTLITQYGVRFQVHQWVQKLDKEARRYGA